MFANRASLTLLRTPLLARPGANLVTVTSSRAAAGARMTLRNKSTSTASPPIPKSGADPAGKSTTSSSSSNPKVEKEPGFFTMIFQGQSKLTIATVIVGAIAADASFTYLTLFHNREEGKFMKEDTFYHRLFSKLGFDLNKVEEVVNPKDQ
ncbi:hypothetical protein EMPS_05823 [Entomortierella parvispora]|uniref:Uncharacterized protein n=1 Tax=Entomortierella parvispora TaxID=205924 RepID=A0A9P3LX45_9FUNG|nr:hypothetical protein EMPS_05823 [Entomortierella parvispora]